MRKFAIILSLLLTPLLRGNCQDNGIIQRLDRRYAELDALISESSALRSVERSFDVEEDSLYARAVDEVTAGKVAAFHAKTGIEIYGQTYYRRGNASDLDGDEIYYGYWGKVQAGIRWNFLQSSVFGRKGQDNEYRMEGSIDMLERRKELQRIAIEQQRSFLQDERDMLLEAALRELASNYAMMKDAYVTLHRSENILADKLIDIIREKDDAERKMAALSPDVPRMEGLPGICAEMMELDTLSFFRQLDESPLDIQILRARSELLRQRADNVSWASQANISPFVNYSMYFRREYPCSAVLNAGVTFSLPANSVAKRTKAAMASERAQLELQTQATRQRLVSWARGIAEDIASLNRSISVEAGHLRNLRSYLEERSEAFSAYKGKYDHLSRMDGYNIYLQGLARLIQLRYERDCLVVDLQEMIGDIQVFDYLKVYEDE